MNRNFRITLALVVYLLGIVAAVYVGGWVMIIKPLHGTMTAYTHGTLALPQVIATVVKCLCSMTVAGLIWCIGYIASNHVYDSRDE